MNNDPERDDLGGTNRLKQSTTQSTGGAGDIAHQAQDKAREMLGTAKEKLGAMGESARTAATAARDRASELMEGARESAQEAYDRARERMNTMSEDGLQYVRENPAKSVMVALLAGVVLGFTLRR